MAETDISKTVYLWKEAWKNKSYRIRLVSTILVLAVVVAILPSFFSYIEQRPGAYLHDLVLQMIPASDVSLPIFIFVWSMSAMALWRCCQDPIFTLQILTCFVLLCLVRMMSILMLPLEPPDGLIALRDPLTSLVYGGKDVFMTKDLFFSGHTSNMFIMYLCLERKRDKQVALSATLLVAMLLMVQHVHYTIDILGAFFITYCVFKVGKWMARI